MEDFKKLDLNAIKNDIEAPSAIRRLADFDKWMNNYEESANYIYSIETQYRLYEIIIWQENLDICEEYVPDAKSSLFSITFHVEGVYEQFNRIEIYGPGTLEDCLKAAIYDHIQMEKMNKGKGEG